MSELPQVLLDYSNSFEKRNIKAMTACYTSDVIYFDPLFGYLDGEQVTAMWQLRLSDLDQFAIALEKIADEGDGYYKMKYSISYRKKDNRPVSMNVQVFFKLDQNRIVEQSEAFSVHALLKQERGMIGHLMGWNRMMQQARKNKARKELLKYLS